METGFQEAKGKIPPCHCVWIFVKSSLMPPLSSTCAKHCCGSVSLVSSSDPYKLLKKTWYCCDCLSFTEEATKAQRGQVTPPNITQLAGGQNRETNPGNLVPGRHTRYCLLLKPAVSSEPQCNSCSLPCLLMPVVGKLRNPCVTQLH